MFSITAETKDDDACGDKAPTNISIDYRDTQIRTLLVEVLLRALTVSPVTPFYEETKTQQKYQKQVKVFQVP